MSGRGKGGKAKGKAKGAHVKRPATAAKRPAARKRPAATDDQPEDMDAEVESDNGGDEEEEVQQPHEEEEVHEPNPKRVRAQPAAADTAHDSGCSKCRWMPVGCGRCREWTDQGLHGYYWGGDNGDEVKFR